MLYGSPLVSETRLRNALAEEGLVDRNAGSTFAALADRELLLTWESLVRVQFLGGTGDVEILYVRMTKKGRAAVRAAIRAASEAGAHDSLP